MILNLVDPDDLAFQTSFEEIETQHQQDPSKKTFWPLIYHQDLPSIFTLVGSVSTQGINSNQFDNKQAVSYSIGVRLTDDDKHKLNEIFDSLFLAISEDREDWKITNPIRNGVIYFKVPIDKSGKVVPKSNIKINARDPTKSAIIQNQQVEVTFSLGSYFDFELKSRKPDETPTRQCGPFLKVSEFTFIKPKGTPTPTEE